MSVQIQTAFERPTVDWQTNAVLLQQRLIDSQERGKAIQDRIQVLGHQLQEILNGSNSPVEIAPDPQLLLKIEECRRSFVRCKLAQEVLQQQLAAALINRDDLAFQLKERLQIMEKRAELESLSIQIDSLEINLEKGRKDNSKLTASMQDLNSDLIGANKLLADHKSMQASLVLKKRDVNTSIETDSGELAKIENNLSKSLIEMETQVLPALQQQIASKDMCIEQLAQDYQSTIVVEGQIDSDLKKKQLENKELKNDISKVLSKDQQKTIWVKNLQSKLHLLQSSLANKNAQVDQILSIQLDKNQPLPSLSRGQSNERHDALISTNSHMSARI